MTRKPRRISVKSASTTTCPGELEAAPPLSLCCAGPGALLGFLRMSGSGTQPRARAHPLCVGGRALTQPHVCCRILSLACSPSGASFICSAAAPSLTSQVDFSAPDIGSKGANQVPGRLLLWDTKSMKQQVQTWPCGPLWDHTPGVAHCLHFPVFLSNRFCPLLWSPQVLICEDISKLKC